MSSRRKTVSRASALAAAAAASIPSNAPGVEVAVPMFLPPEFVEAVAARAADLLAERVHAHVEPWMSVDDAAGHLACPVSRIYRLVALAKGGRQANPIPYCKDGQRLLFRRSELDAWAGRGGGPGR